jgi:hypothetical protein
MRCSVLSEETTFDYLTLPFRVEIDEYMHFKALYEERGLSYSEAMRYAMALAKKSWLQLKQGGAEPQEPPKPKIKLKKT